MKGVGGRRSGSKSKIRQLTEVTRRRHLNDSCSKKRNLLTVNGQVHPLVCLGSYINLCFSSDLYSSNCIYLRWRSWSSWGRLWLERPQPTQACLVGQEAWEAYLYHLGVVGLGQEIYNLSRQIQSTWFSQAATCAEYSAAGPTTCSSILAFRSHSEISTFG